MATKLRQIHTQSLPEFQSNDLSTQLHGARLESCLLQSITEPFIDAKLSQCREIQQPFPYVDLWDLTLLSQDKTLLNDGISGASQKILMNTIDILLLKMDLEAEHKKPVDFVAQQGQVITPVSNAFAPADYATLGSLFSHMPVFNDNGAPGVNIPNADQLSLNDDTLVRLESLAHKMGTSISPKNINQMCSYLANSAVNFRHITENFEDSTRFGLMAKNSTSSKDFHNISQMIL